MILRGAVSTRCVVIEAVILNILPDLEAGFYYQLLGLEIDCL